ncbi:hypothetical protein [Microbacterium sp. NPDC076911]|uniref:hypothetical protein n=1 Tax=Microbacterium sp. NPDC076911 TaxID=3154958 RepID=UPI0034424238
MTRPALETVTARARRMLRAAAVKFGGLPHSVGTVDSPPPEVARDITTLWKRNSDPRQSERIVDESSLVTVTMTTHGRRIEDVWLALESIGRGTVLPGRLILWLDSAPKRQNWRLRRLEKRGLEIRYCEPGFGVHTKYWPYLLESAAEVPLVLSDDDIVYPATWLEHLMRVHLEHPELVVAYRAHVIGMSDDGFLPYATWRSCDDDEPSFAHFATSVSGQILPVPLQRALLDEGDIFRTLAPSADDVWLHRTAVISGFRTRQVAQGQQHWWFIPGSQVSGLNALNVAGGANDVQMAAAHTPLSRERIRADLFGG